MRNYLLFNLFIIGVFGSCADGKEEGRPTCDVCEPLTTKSLCEDEGCTFPATINRGVLKDGKCVAMELDVSMCIAADGPVGNIEQAWYRTTPEGNEVISLGYAYQNVDGWTDCGGMWQNNPECACGVATSVCTAQMDRASCEANYCFWAENVREAIIEGEACTGWQPETTSYCVAPAGPMPLLNGESFYKMEAAPVTYYFPDNGGTRVVTFSAHPDAAIFRSGSDSAPVYWSKCNGLGSDPEVCDCPAK
ncbi:hypothetical protein KKD52_01645 [Myxococcota bacterium]|nr:hypothetical protein [Myxococcota bacterium]